MFRVIDIVEKIFPLGGHVHPGDKQVSRELAHANLSSNEFVLDHGAIGCQAALNSLHQGPHPQLR